MSHPESPRAPRSLSLKSTPDLLKQEAKRWLHAIRANDTDAMQRLTTVWPAAPLAPTLRDVQHALAREHGYVDWRALHAALDELAVDRQSHAERVDALLRHGWGGDRVLSSRILARDPSIARTNLFTAAACGDLTHVERELARDATAATRTGGPLAWSALAYVCYSRLDSTHAVAIAERLLDAGADANFAFDDGWGNPFTCITGAIGLGEGVKPSHTQARALVDLLLARGANAFDTQALYNSSIAFDDPSWTEVLWQASVRADVTAQWSQIDGPSLGGTIKVGTLNYLLGNAVTNQHLARATWLLEHGADARTRHSYTGHTVHTTARLAGNAAMLALLERHGATPDTLSTEQRVLAALAAGDESAARALLAANASLATHPSLLPTVAGRGNTRAVLLLLEYGASVNAADHEGATALHWAAHAGAVQTVAALLTAGADVNRRDARFHGTPLSWAVALHKPLVVEQLVPVSRDARALTRLGRAARLAAVLADEPALANERLAGVPDPTPLFCLPDDEQLAVEVAQVLLAHGADRRATDAKGHTAADAARRRGLDDAADLLSQ